MLFIKPGVGLPLRCNYTSLPCRNAPFGNLSRDFGAEIQDIVVISEQ